jgi:hypothetical protein
VSSSNGLIFFNFISSIGIIFFTYIIQHIGEIINTFFISDKKNSPTVYPVGDAQLF